MKTIKDLEGKTITTATLMKKPDYDDQAWLRLRFSDGSECFVVGSYREYSGASEDEYPAYVFVTDKIEDALVEVQS